MDPFVPSGFGEMTSGVPSCAALTALSTVSARPPKPGATAKNWTPGLDRASGSVCIGVWWTTVVVKPSAVASSRAAFSVSSPSSALELYWKWSLSLVTVVGGRPLGRPVVAELILRHRDDMDRARALDAVADRLAHLRERLAGFADIGDVADAERRHPAADRRADGVRRCHRAVDRARDVRHAAVRSQH